jgi:hypothetical protein
VEFFGTFGVYLQVGGVCWSTIEILKMVGDVDEVDNVRFNIF